MVTLAAWTVYVYNERQGRVQAEGKVGETIPDGWALSYVISYPKLCGGTLPRHQDMSHLGMQRSQAEPRFAIAFELGSADIHCPTICRRFYPTDCRR